MSLLLLLSMRCVCVCFERATPPHPIPHTKPNQTMYGQHQEADGLGNPIDGGGQHVWVVVSLMNWNRLNVFCWHLYIQRYIYIYITNLPHPIPSPMNLVMMFGTRSTNGIPPSSSKFGLSSAQVPTYLEKKATHFSCRWNAWRQERMTQNKKQNY